MAASPSTSASNAVSLECPFSVSFKSQNSAPPSPSPLSQSFGSLKLPGTVPECLPTFFHDQKQLVVPVENHVPEFLRRDLDVSRINKIHGWLWMCGRPLNARPLHRQTILGRTVVVCEQCDLHLLYHSTIIYIKPLPAYLLIPEFWSQYLCDDVELHQAACGFLLSYIWLIRTQTDFRRAKEEDAPLLPDFVTWTEWKALVASFINRIDVDALDQVNMRYRYGELRLGRINTVYRFAPQLAFSHFVRGYLYQYNRYAAYFHRNFGWMLIVFAFFSLLLSAMQVGVSVKPLDDNDAFRNASYGFVAFSTVLVAAVLAFVTVLFAGVFFFNMIAAISHSVSAAKRRGQLALRRREREKEP